MRESTQTCSQDKCGNAPEPLGFVASRTGSAEDLANKLCLGGGSQKNAGQQVEGLSRYALKLLSHGPLRKASLKVLSRYSQGTLWVLSRYSHTLFSSYSQGTLKRCAQKVYTILSKGILSKGTLKKYSQKVLSEATQKTRNLNSYSPTEGTLKVNVLQQAHPLLASPPSKS